MRTRQWSEASPAFLRLLDKYAEGGERSDASSDALFFILHLAGAVGETQAFPDLCCLLHDGEASRRVLGDAITETLRGIVIGTFGGDSTELRAVIDDPGADEFARDSLLLMIAYLARTDRITEPEMRDYLTGLIDRLDPELDDVVIASWFMAVALLGYKDLALGSRRCLNETKWNMRSSHCGISGT